jgi:hypothetical protein
MPQERCEHRSVAVPDLPPDGRAIAVDQLITGDQQSDAGCSVQSNAARARGGRDGQLARTEAITRPEDRIACSNVGAARANMLAGPGGAADRHDFPPVGKGCFLNRNDRVGAWRDRSPGIDLCGLAACELRKASGAGRHLPDHPQRRRYAAHVLTAHGVTIHDRPVERRHVHVAAHSLRQGASDRLARVE